MWEVTNTMTAITIDKLLLEQVQDLLYRVTRWKGENHEVLTDLHDIKEAVKAVLAAPASAPEPVAWMSPKRFYRTRAMALINGEQLIEPLYLHPPATAPDELERKPSAKEVAWDRIRRSLVVRNAQITIGDVADTMDWQLNDAMKGTP